MPCCRQNSCRPMPLAEYSATNCLASTGFRRRRVSGACASSIPSVQQGSDAGERWVALTVTDNQTPIGRYAWGTSISDACVDGNSGKPVVHIWGIGNEHVPAEHGKLQIRL